MGWKRNFTNFTKGVAATLPGAIDKYTALTDKRKEEKKQQALTSYQAAQKAGDVRGMRRVAMENPEWAPLFNSLIGSSKAEQENTSGDLKAQIDSVLSQLDSARTQERVDDLNKQFNELTGKLAMSTSRFKAYGEDTPALPGAPGLTPPGPGLVPAAPGATAPTGMPPTPPVAPPATLGGLGGAAVPSSGITLPTAPTSLTVPTAPLSGADRFTKKQLELNQRSMSTSHIAKLEHYASLGLLETLTDENIEGIVRELSISSGFSPDDPNVRKAAQMQVRELFNANNVRVRERQVELETQRLQNQEIVKRMSVLDLQFQQNRHQDMMINYEHYSPDELLGEGFSLSLLKFLGPVPVEMRSQVLSSSDALPLYKKFKEDNKITDTGYDVGEQTIRMMSGLSAQTRYTAMKTAGVLAYMKDPNNSTKTEAETEKYMESLDQMVRASTGYKLPQEEDQTEKVLTRKFSDTVPEEDQVANALVLWGQGKDGQSAAVKIAQTITNERVKQVLMTGKDPHEDMPWMETGAQYVTAGGRAVIGGLAGAAGYVLNPGEHGLAGDLQRGTEKGIRQGFSSTPQKPAPVGR